MCRSKQNPDTIWVASSDGRVFQANWTVSKTSASFQTRSATAQAMAVVSKNISGKTEEVILVTESDKPHRVEVVAYLAKIQAEFESKTVLSMKKSGNGLQLLESSEDGQVLVGAINDRLFFGAPSKQNFDSLMDIEYEIYTFDIPDLVTALDLRVYPRLAMGKKSRSETGPVLDVVVGGARGSIYVYHDVLARSQALGKSGADKEMIQAQNFHWHRKAVHAVKWSRDGTYAGL